MTTKIKNIILTDHAQRRMCGRRININMAEKVLLYGRKIHQKGAEYHIIGKKEVIKYKHRGIDLRDLEGIHVVVQKNSDAYVILTVFRNRDLVS